MEILVRLFERTLINSLEAAVMIVALLLLIRAFRRRLAPTWQYALWILVVAKLMLPWLPGNLEGQLRWLSLPGEVEAHLPSRHTDGILDANQLVNVTDATDVSSRMNRENAKGVSAIAPLDSDWQRSGIVLRISVIVWLSGMALAWAMLLGGHLRMSFTLRREARFAVPQELDELFTRIRASRGIRSSVRLRLTRLVSTPALFGILSPVVLIPRKFVGHLTEAEWECVVRHELTHLKRMDIPVNLLAHLLASVHWFNPVVWYGLRRMRIDQESACDANVLSSSELKETYAASLIKLLEIGVSQRTVSTGVGFYGNKNQIKRRIVMIRDFQPAKKKVSFIGLSILIVTALLALPSAFAAGKESPAEAAEQPAALEQITDKQSLENTLEISLILPVSGKITSLYGYRIHPITSKKSLHDGIDIANKKGTDVAAAAGGKVIQAGSVKAKGFTITIEHNKVWSTEYRHLDKLSVEEGDKVESGDLIGLMGSTGNSTGPHLHFSVLKNGNYVDPMPVTTLKLKGN